MPVYFSIDESLLHIDPEDISLEFILNEEKWEMDFDYSFFAICDTNKLTIDEDIIKQDRTSNFIHKDYGY